MSEAYLWGAPGDIEERSMNIIEAEMPAADLTEAELEVVKRCIHATADFDYAVNLTFTPGVTDLACGVFRAGGFTIVTDTAMVLAGINKKALDNLGGKAVCFMEDEDVAEEAKMRGITRAAVSMEKASGIGGPLVIASGNAPTALLRLEELMRDGEILPSFVIAAPVGFVNVEEAKERILAFPVPSIVARGRKGGSGVAAAICNALLYRAVR